MPLAPLDAAEKKLIHSIVKKYEESRETAEYFRKTLVLDLEAPRLSPYVHSIKSRLKDSDHFRDKLERKLKQCKEAGKEFDYRPENLFEMTNDLVGARILHLHTRQVKHLHPMLLEIFTGPQYSLVEDPFVRTWDDESRAFFEELGIQCQTSESMYTSIHYVVSSNSSALITAEIQMRTLSEELWGEIDHKINYPYETDSIACREQIKALARATSTSTRLVDSIISSYDEHSSRKRKK